MHPTTIRVLTGLLAIGFAWVFFYGDLSGLSHFRKAGLILITVLFALHASFGDAGSAWVLKKCFGYEAPVKEESNPAKDAISNALNHDKPKYPITSPPESSSPSPPPGRDRPAA